MGEAICGLGELISFCLTRTNLDSCVAFSIRTFKCLFLSYWSENRSLHMVFVCVDRLKWRNLNYIDDDTSVMENNVPIGYWQKAQWTYFSRHVMNLNLIKAFSWVSVQNLNSFSACGLSSVLRASSLFAHTCITYCESSDTRTFIASANSIKLWVFFKSALMP